MFEVDATAVEPVFQKLYSYIFDMDNSGYNAAEMDRPVPSAIFIVNFDKVYSAVLCNSLLWLSSMNIAN